MLAYLGIEMAKKKEASGYCNFDSLKLKLPEMSCRLVERLVTVYKSPHQCHRNILDTEHQFLNYVVNWMKSEAVSEHSHN